MSESNKTSTSTYVYAIIVAFVAFIVSNIIFDFPFYVPEPDLKMVPLDGVHYVALWARIGVVMVAYHTVKKVLDLVGN